MTNESYVPGEDLVACMRRHRRNGLAEMSAGLAHEINQPLSGIRGIAEALLIGLEEGWNITQEEITGNMRRLIHEADRIDDLIQSVRSFADDQDCIDIVEVDLIAVVRATTHLMSSGMQTHGVTWHTQAHGLPPGVRANPFALQEVVQILISNAMDACRQRHSPNGGEVAIIIDGGASHADPILLRITDNGCGMDAPILARAGEPFFTTKGPDRGVGLGLATAHSILAKCGGQLELTSTPGVGTTATLRLCHRADMAVAPSATASAVT